jgi:alkylation response protein AidB-like acyl-CoA dehydrogenase
LDLARELAAQFAINAAERDHLGGTPKAERDQLRQSGLLKMSIPTAYGGSGANWSETMAVVREFAKVDSSVAHVFGFQHLMLATIRLFGSPRQWEPWFENTARRNWFWGNAVNPLDRRTVCKQFDGWREFSGKKNFCSGAIDSEMLIASAYPENRQGLIIAALPTARSGITVLQDWDNIGQRQTDSGSVNFERVRVDEAEILSDPGPLSTPSSCLRPLIAQLILANIYVGISIGALAEAKRYTLHEARPWHAAHVDRASDDPYVLAHYGEFCVGLESMRVLADRAAHLLDEAWHAGDALTLAQRGDVAVAVAIAKVAASTTGLDLCSRMFEVTGARSTHAGLGLDRHWRNLRTHTLHDPLDYKVRELGEWTLKGLHPKPSFYS